LDLLKCPQAALNQSESPGGKLDGAIITLQDMSEIRNLAGAMDVGLSLSSRERFFMGNIESSTWLRGYIFDSISIYLELEECWLNINNHQQRGGGGA
jgi:hypothetical protein